MWRTLLVKAHAAVAPHTNGRRSASESWPLLLFLQHGENGSFLFSAESHSPIGGGQVPGKCALEALDWVPGHNGASRQPFCQKKRGETQRRLSHAACGTPSLPFVVAGLGVDARGVDTDLVASYEPYEMAAKDLHARHGAVSGWLRGNEPGWRRSWLREAH